MISSCFKSACVLSLSLYSFVVYSAEYKVKDQAEYVKALSSLEAGDSIVLANGVWNDFEILFEGKGTEKSPITLIAETKGKVIITGESNLSLAGEHLVVSGLVFKNGYTPTSSVITFRKNKTELANHSRVTEVVIDNFSNPERFENDYWVAMYGRHNLSLIHI